MESQSLRGTSEIKMFFQPGAYMNRAAAQVTALCQSVTKPLPPGIAPPHVLQYNASDIPAIMLSLGSDQVSEHEINDLDSNFLSQLVTVQEAAEG